MEKLAQAGGIAFRKRRGAWEFLLVTSKGGNWIFPKGIVEPGESAEDTAAKECREEAGIRGRVLPGRVGSYPLRKWKHDCCVDIFLIEYEEYVEPWEEKNIRDRCWCTYEDAAERLKKDDLRRILRSALRRLERESVEVSPSSAG